MKPRSLLPFLGVCVVAVALSACGSGSGSNSSSTSIDSQSSSGSTQGSSSSTQSGSSSQSGSGSSSTQASAGTLAIAQSSYSVLQSSGSVTVTVTRSGGSSGAISVNYSTADGTAVAGTDYTKAAGTLQWGAGDSSSKAIAVTISNASPFTGTKAFSIAISSPTGSASLGTPATGTVTITGSGAVQTPLAVKVQGNHLVDASGNVLQLRGVNVSGLEFVAVQGWDPANPWGAQTGTATPDWNTMKTWDINAVRIPLNEASWLGYTCTDSSGANRNPDPGANYKATVANTVSSATAAGLYVILDLHWTAPAAFCPLAQNQMADADNSVSFWSSIATEFKSYPNVMFELFNEPFVGDSSPSATDWTTMMQGGPQTTFVTGGNPYQESYNWTVAGMQQMLNAVRATGATNVVLVGTTSWSQDLSDWVTYAPTDPDHQMAAVWHAYSNASSDPTTTVPLFGTQAYTWAQNVLSAGYPVVITETGDWNAPGTTGAPYLQNLLPWADAHQVSYLGWAWDVWQNSANVLIKDAAGDPTDGYGVYFKQHLTCLGSGKSSCP
jgi:endoglucanase